MALDSRTKDAFDWIKEKNPNHYTKSSLNSVVVTFPCGLRGSSVTKRYRLGTVPFGNSGVKRRLTSSTDFASWEWNPASEATMTAPRYGPFSPSRTVNATSSMPSRMCFSSSAMSTASSRNATRTS